MARVLTERTASRRQSGFSVPVKNYVSEHGRRSREMFVPLAHAPGHAQADVLRGTATTDGQLHFASPEVGLEGGGELNFDDAITFTSLATRVVTTDKFAANFITSAKITANAITTGLIRNLPLRTRSSGMRRKRVGHA